jgi:hypothetical protein
VRTCVVAKVWVAQPRITLVDPGYLMGGCRRLGRGGEGRVGKTEASHKSRLTGSHPI